MQMTLEEACNSFYEDIIKYCYYRTSKNKPDAEDIAGEVFLRLGKKWDTLENYDKNRVLGWLYNTAENVILEYQRKQIIQNDLTVSITDENGIDDEFADESIDGYEENIKFEHYISQIKKELSHEEFEFFNYVIIQNLPYKDVGQKLHISESAVKMRRRRLSRKLIPILDKLFGR